MRWNEHKILFTGPMGAGKTTAIATLSEIAPLTTEVVNTARHVYNKETTTVGLDYGEITLDSGEKVRLYGTPGQERFSTLWDILSEGALGAILLIDHSSDDSEQCLEEFLVSFDRLIQATGAVVGVTHADIAPEKSFGPYYEKLAARSLVLPVFPVDPRNREDILGAVDALLSVVEVRWSEE